MQFDLRSVDAYSLFPRSCRPSSTCEAGLFEQAHQSKASKVRKIYSSIICPPLLPINSFLKIKCQVSRFLTSSRVEIWKWMCQHIVIQRTMQVLCGCWSGWGWICTTATPPPLPVLEIEYKDQSRSTRRGCRRRVVVGLCRNIIFIFDEWRDMHLFLRESFNSNRENAKKDIKTHSLQSYPTQVTQR